MDPEKRAWFDATVAAYNAPGHPPMVFCGVKFSGLHIVKSKKPPHSLKLGALPCYLVPPQGFLTEESAVAAPR
jgi:hypothetical protein